MVSVAECQWLEGEFENVEIGVQRVKFLMEREAWYFTAEGSGRLAGGGAILAHARRRLVRLPRDACSAHWRSSLVLHTASVAVLGSCTCVVSHQDLVVVSYAL
jgi:hypothetical protein